MFLGTKTSSLLNYPFIGVKCHVSLHKWIFLLSNLVSFLGLLPKKSDGGSEIGNMTCSESELTQRGISLFHGVMKLTCLRSL